MNISDYISFGSLAVSVVVAACSYVSYKKHGRRLNEQQALINEYIIEQHEKEDLKSRCADLRCCITPRELIVTNKGMAKATDIEISFKSSSIIHPSKFPIIISSIAPGDSFDIIIHRAESPQKEQHISISWQDGRGVRQYAELNVPLS